MVESYGNVTPGSTLYSQLPLFGISLVSLMVLSNFLDEHSDTSHGVYDLVTLASLVKTNLRLTILKT